jgi:DNA-binding transcriptional LysR family regulator
MVKATSDLGDIALFAAVAEERSFLEAARRKGGSAALMSRAVRRLESAIGATLLNVTTHSVTLTDAGQALLDRVAPALAEIGTAIDRVGDLAQAPIGSLRLNVPTIVARRILPPIVARFLTAHPGIRMEVIAEDNFIDVLAAGFDAGVRYDERLARDVTAIPLGPRRQRYVAGAAKSYLAAHGKPKHPRELVDHRIISHPFAHAAPYAWEFVKNGRTMKIRPEGPITTSSFEIELAAAHAGLGIACGFEDDWGESIRRGELQPVLQDWWTEFSGPSLFFPSGRHIRAPLRAFVELLKRERRGPP